MVRVDPSLPCLPLAMPSPSPHPSDASIGADRRGTVSVPVREQGCARSVAKHGADLYGIGRGWMPDRRARCVSQFLVAAADHAASAIRPWDDLNRCGLITSSIMDITIPTKTTATDESPGMAPATEAPPPVTSRPGPIDARDVATPSWREMGLAIWHSFRANPIFWIGIAALAIPTLLDLASRGWGTDAAAHAPIVFATAIWIFARSARQAAAAAVPPPAWRAVLLLAPLLLLYAASRITGLLEVRGLAAYLSIVAVLYAVGGLPVLKVLWFPILYSIFLIPIPETFIDVGTQPIKLAISKSVVGLLSALGYPVATSGVSIYIGQFELLIAAACAGLNSLISLTAIGSFYVYLRHNA
ncbi:MAG: exosortase/archaeosortase family protein, partial [Sphingomonas sp.]